MSFFSWFPCFRVALSNLFSLVCVPLDPGSMKNSAIRLTHLFLNSTYLPLSGTVGSFIFKSISYKNPAVYSIFSLTASHEILLPVSWVYQYLFPQRPTYLAALPHEVRQFHLAMVPCMLSFPWLKTKIISPLTTSFCIKTKCCMFYFFHENILCFTQSLWDRL